MSACDLSILAQGIPSPLPAEHPPLDPSVPHAPSRPAVLTQEETRLALKNVLRYFPLSDHEAVGAECAEELRTLGHIYCNRLRPTQYEMKAYHLDRYRVSGIDYTHTQHFYTKHVRHARHSRLIRSGLNH